MRHLAIFPRFPVKTPPSFHDNHDRPNQKAQTLDNIHLKVTDVVIASRLGDVDVGVGAEVVVVYDSGILKGRIHQLYDSL